MLNKVKKEKYNNDFAQFPLINTKPIATTFNSIACAYDDYF